jgi:hypothetical protein
MRFEVLMAVRVQMVVVVMMMMFWVLVPCRFVGRCQQCGKTSAPSLGHQT